MPTEDKENLSILVNPTTSHIYSLNGSYNVNVSFGYAFNNTLLNSTLLDFPLTARIILSVLYSCVCAVGLVGNVLVMHLLRTAKGRKTSTINFFVFNLALTDFCFSLTLPFWAVEVVLDYHWPFGNVMCKMISSLATLYMYSGAFFLTAMAATRYWSVVSALRPRTRLSVCSIKWIALLIWVVACCASLPPLIFSRSIQVHGVEMCIQKFPGLKWLGIYHIQKLMLGFIIPFSVVSTCYIMLLCFLNQQHLTAQNPQRQNRITKSVTIVVMSFFICWIPNHIITFWGALVKLDVVPWSHAYYFTQTYIFPISICFTDAGSCLNPVIYCLMRKEFRKALKVTFWKFSTSSFSQTCLIYAGCRVKEQDNFVVLPLNGMDSQSCPQPSHIYSKRYTTHSTTTTALQKL
ncbi:relaxin-3 receptor 1-like [Protopterus annectens]|uniref:relaxin-3 receptor 1-like n=1 Tax=Protopterus annectens TaxID=7888 RepID=UPI001CFAE32B|nr:relaxin-3 receptor 1-like [Protopterus annectens]